jgi:hypothetical protein
VWLHGFPSLLSKKPRSDSHAAGPYNQLRRDVERCILQTIQEPDRNTLYLLRTIPGIGAIRSLVWLAEMRDLQRFPRRSEFVSYCRFVTHVPGNPWGSVMAPRGPRLAMSP